MQLEVRRKHPYLLNTNTYPQPTAKKGDQPFPYYSMDLCLPLTLRTWSSGQEIQYAASALPKMP